MSASAAKGPEGKYGNSREAVGWGLVAITPLNLLLAYLLNYLDPASSGPFTTQVIYSLSVSASFSLIGVVLVIEEIAFRVQEREKKKVKRQEGAVCPVCGAVMRPGQARCSICGSSPLRECPNCGTLMSISSKMCSRCGYSND